VNAVGEHPARRSVLRRELDDALLDEWTAFARCRSVTVGGEGPQRPGMPWSAMFDDELAMRPHPDDYRWPPKLVDLMEMCAGCPVRRRCLEAAFEVEGHAQVIDRDVGHYAPHREACEDSTCEGCVPEEERVTFRDVVIEVIPSGIYGGVPARVRQYFMDVPCPDHTEGGCGLCGNRRSVLREDRVEACDTWARGFAARMGWASLDDDAIIEVA